MKKKEFLYISIGILLTVISWFIADVYRAFSEKKIKNKVDIPQFSNYKIDQEILKIIENKEE